MSSLAEEIAKFSNPTPNIEDPEDDINVETSAKLSNKFEDDDDNAAERVSSLRLQNAPLLHEFDARYSGKRVSRKSLEEAQRSASSEEESEQDGSSMDEDDDKEIESFKQLIGQKAVEDERSDISQDDSEKAELDGQDEDSGDNEENDDDEIEEESEDDIDDDEDNEDFIQKFSTCDVKDEIDRGKATQKQQELWSKLCEWRITLQKLLVVANRLPQHDVWYDFNKNAEHSYNENLDKSSKSISKLLSNLLDFQDVLLKYIPESTSTAANSEKTGPDDDEEIPSDSGDEREPLPSLKTNISMQKTRKRKRDIESYEECLNKKHKSFSAYRTSVIQKWDEKTRLSTGRLTSKQNFTMFDQSAVKQINQILQDKPRLIKRTQMMRSEYHIFGKTPSAESEESEEKKCDIKNYDPEIFDDDDFYRQLLKDVIETKSTMVDPLVISKQLEIQRARSKMNRKVDTKASKGRRIRFDVHPKMVNIMAPMYEPTMEEDARDELFKSLFGQRPAIVAAR